MHYEVQHNTRTNGWANTWLYVGADGHLRQETFESPEEAEAALNEHLQDLEDELQAGNIAGYNRDDFRVQHVPATATQPHHQQGEHP